MESTGTLTRKGYRRTYAGGGKSRPRQRFVHNIVWELANGPIPDGMQIHHINGDKEDNRLENLQLVTPTEHKRIHSEHFRSGLDGNWERQCSCCQQWFPATAEHFYFSKKGWVLYGRCRPCHVARVVADKRARRQAAVLHRQGDAG